MLSKSAKYLSPAIYRVSDLIVKRAAGCWLETEKGKVLDFTSGIGTLSTGHSHPKICKAVTDQVAKAMHIQQHLLVQTHAVELSMEIDKFMPVKNNRYFYNVTGSEAVDSAIKLARNYTGKSNIISFEKGFHGRSFSGLSLNSSNLMLRAKSGPFLPGCYVSYVNEDDEVSLYNLRNLLQKQTRPDETAAMLIEVVQGEGGYRIFSKNFLKGIRQICDEFDILLIADEVQCGVGRTGKFLAYEHSNIIPDITVMAKGIASGLPLSLIVGKPELYETSPLGSMGSTFGPNIVSCAAAKATLEIIAEENLMENSQKMGKYFLEELNKLKNKYPDDIHDVRGMGLMLAIEFCSMLPENFIENFLKICCDNKLLVMSARGNVIRLIPPLIVNKKEIDFAIKIIDNVLLGNILKKFN